LTGVLYYLKPKVFRFFLNDLNPLLVVSVLAVSGYLLLGSLRPYGFMVHRERDNAKPIKFILMARAGGLFNSSARILREVDWRKAG